MEKIDWYLCGDLYCRYGRWEFVFTEEEIQEVIEEFLHKGAKNLISRETANSILRSRKRHEEYLNSVHPSHEMTEWGTKIIAPVGTPRFYAHRECKKCGGEQYHHPAGKFIDGCLKSKCRGEEYGE